MKKSCERDREREKEETLWRGGNTIIEAAVVS
jgi:hypothetical protein